MRAAEESGGPAEAPSLTWNIALGAVAPRAARLTKTGSRHSAIETPNPGFFYEQGALDARAGGSPDLDVADLQFLRGMTMERIELARRYFDRLVAGDGAGAAALFSEDGAIDDYLGGHHSGRDGIQRFIDSVIPGAVTLDAPLYAFEEADRLNVYGTLLRPGESEADRVRWVFHFKGTLASHLCNSRVVELLSP